jgi:deoxyribonuclease-4
MSFDAIEAADDLVDRLEAAVGLQRLACLHVNDSKVPRGAGLDRHENVGRGAIGRSAFRALLGHPRLQGLPAVLEVPGTDGQGPDRRELARLRRLHAEGVKLRRGPQ